MILKQYTPSSVEPIHLTEAKIHLRAGGSVNETSAALYTAENSLISNGIAAARDAAETEQWRSLVLQTWDMYLDAFPGGNSIELPLPPLRAVEFVRYTDSSGVTYDFDDWTVDLASLYGRIILDSDYSWPSTTLSPNNPVHIRFKCGYLVPFTRAGGTIAFADNPFTVGDRVQLSVSGGALPAPLLSHTNYYITATGLSLTDGGDDVVVTTDGTGSFFVGQLPYCTNVGMKLILSDLYEQRSDTIGIASRLTNITLPRGASHWFSMDTARRF